MQTASPTVRLIEIKLGRPLRDYVAERRPDKGWRTIAREILADTDEHISHEWLRTWFTTRSDDAARRTA